jgi:hypothetical protein
MGVGCGDVGHRVRSLGRWYFVGRQLLGCRTDRGCELSGADESLLPALGHRPRDDRIECSQCRIPHARRSRAEVHQHQLGSTYPMAFAWAPSSVSYSSYWRFYPSGAYGATAGAAFNVFTRGYYAIAQEARFYDVATGAYVTRQIDWARTYYGAYYCCF